MGGSRVGRREPGSVTRRETSHENPIRFAADGVPSGPGAGRMSSVPAWSGKPVGSPSPEGRDRLNPFPPVVGRKPDNGGEPESKPCEGLSPLTGRHIKRGRGICIPFLDRGSVG